MAENVTAVEIQEAIGRALGAAGGRMEEEALIAAVSAELGVEPERIRAVILQEDDRWSPPPEFLRDLLARPDNSEGVMREMREAREETLASLREASVRLDFVAGRTDPDAVAMRHMLEAGVKKLEANLREADALIALGERLLPAWRENPKLTIGEIEAHLKNARTSTEP